MIDESNTKNTLSDSGAETTASLESSQKKIPEKKDYQIDIFRDWCKSCGICSAFCPRQCIQLDESGSPFVKDSKLCSGCGWCEVHCPDFAISVRQKRRRTTRENVD